MYILTQICQIMYLMIFHLLVMYIKYMRFVMELIALLSDILLRYITFLFFLKLVYVEESLYINCNLRDKIPTV